MQDMDKLLAELREMEKHLQGAVRTINQVSNAIRCKTGDST